MEVNLVLQDDPSMILYKVIDKIVEFPKLDIGDSLIERKLSTHHNTTYLINSLTNQILIINKKVLGKKGVILAKKPAKKIYRLTI